GVPSPFDAFLTLRGIKTLALRMERHCANALEVARFLQSHSKVQKVFYPGLESHPQHALAKRQMNGRYGGMVTAVLKGGLERSRRFLERCKLFTLAESLGGVESLIEHPAIMTHASLPEDVRDELGIDEGLVRLSVGIESGGRTVRNIQTTQPSPIVVGAHYDTVPGSPGADDNASAVAVLIELAAMRLPVRFVAFANEEMPYFLGPEMGSFVSARRSRERGENLRAMFSLEMLGYYRDDPGSQHYPAPLGWFYPDRADFIGFVGDLGARALVRRSIA